MLNTTKRTESDALLEELASLEAAVPDRAARFHQVLAELRGDVEKAAARWSVLRGGDTFTGPRERASALGALAAELGELFDSAHALVGEIADLRSRAAELDDLEISRWVKGRVDPWSATLESLATDAAPGAGLGTERAALAGIEDDLRLLFQALFWLGQLEEAFELFQDHVPAEHDDERRTLREQLFTRGVTAERLVELRSSIDRVKAAAEREAERPPQLRTVAELLPMLQRWATELAFSADAVRELDARHKKVVVEEWTGQLPQELLDKTQSLIRELTERGVAVRDQRLDELRRWKEELFAICGEQAVIRDGVERLEQKEITRPEGHRQWMRDADRLGERMVAIANNQRADLERRLDSRLGELRDALADLLADPLSDDVLQQARHTEHEGEALVEPSGAGEALSALLRAAELVAAVAELRRRSRHETEALRQDQEALRRDSGELREAASALGWSVPDPGGRIDDLTSAADSLEQCRLAATHLVCEVADLRADFVERCQGHVAETVRSAAESLELLVRAEPETVPLPPPVIAADSGPEAAAAAVLAGREMAAALAARIEAAVERLEERRVCALEELHRRATDELSPGDRDAAERLTGDLAGAEASGDDEAGVARLRELTGLVEGFELFRDRVEEARRHVAEKREGLRRRLEVLQDENLGGFCPWLTDRVTALVYGLPAAPPPSADVRRQLELAEDLCGKLERQVRRVAAHRLAADARRLEESGDDEATTLLETLERHGHHSLPPAALRLRLRRAAAQR